MATKVLQGIPFLRQELTKLFMKKAAEKSGIMTVPFKNKKLQLDIENRLQKYITDAEKQGVDLDMVSNENLKYTINLNENVDPISRAISADSPEGKAITEKLFGKKGEVVSFKDKIEAMKKSGDIVDVGDVKISKKITDREMFKNSNLNKPTIEGQMEKITGASNKIKEIQKEIDNMYKPKSDANQRLKGPIKEKQDMGPFGKVDVETDYSSSINRPEFFDPKAKNMFGKTVKTGVEFIQKEKERILNLINNKKKNMVPPTHSNYKLLKKSLQDQEDALEAIKVTEDLGGNENMFDFLRTKNIADYKAKPLQRSNYTKTDAEIKAEIEAGNKKGIESLKNKKDDPEGFYTGGIVDVEPSLDDIGHGSDALMARTRLVSPGNQATTSTGLNYLLAEDNDNMRVPFSKGKLADAARRKFIKTAGGIGAGITALKTGLLGFGKEAAPVVEKTVETVSETAKGVPPYFFKLVDKIKSFGEDVTPSYAVKDRQKVTKYKDYELTEDVTTGEKTIQRMKVDDDLKYDASEYYGKPVGEEVYMNYKPGKGQIDETTKGKTPPDEYTEDTSLIRSDKPVEGEVMDTFDGVPDDVLKEVEAGSGNVPESFYTGPNPIKKADGGLAAMLGE